MNVEKITVPGLTGRKATRRSGRGQDRHGHRVRRDVRGAGRRGRGRRHPRRRLDGHGRPGRAEHAARDPRRDGVPHPPGQPGGHPCAPGRRPALRLVPGQRAPGDREQRAAREGGRRGGGQARGRRDDGRHDRGHHPGRHPRDGPHRPHPAVLPPDGRPPRAGPAQRQPGRWAGPPPRRRQGRRGRRRVQRRRSRACPASWRPRSRPALHPDHRHRRRTRVRRPGARAPRRARADPEPVQVRQGLRRPALRGRSARCRPTPPTSAPRPSPTTTTRSTSNDWWTCSTTRRPRSAGRASHRKAGQRIGFVPTMGALHDGHLRLVEVARSRAATRRRVDLRQPDPVQPARPTSTSTPARSTTTVARCARSRRRRACTCRPPATMYPAGFQTHVDPGPLGEPMEGAVRPGHFRGVTTVVTKLFLAVRPDVARVRREGLPAAAPSSAG